MARKHTEETKRKMSEAHKKLHDNHRHLIGGGHNKGWKLTELAQKYPAPDTRPGRAGTLSVNLVNDVRASAKRREIEWSLTDIEAYELIVQACDYCGHSVDATTGERNGLDRLDSSQGYRVDNVVPCCRWCNSGKLERTPEEFKAYAMRLYLKLYA